MSLGTAKASGPLVLLAICVAVVPASAAARPGLTASVSTVPGHGASAASSASVLTLNDQRHIDNRITAHADPTGRLVLTAPEGLGDPDGSGPNCRLDNAKSGEQSATQVSCDAGYIGAIVGDLATGSDSFDADPFLTVMVGAVIDGEQRPLSGGAGRDRLVGGAGQDLLDGGGGPDSLIGGGADDVITGGPDADNLSGGLGNDSLFGGAAGDRINGGGGKDLCRGQAGADSAKGCETGHS
jgi:RTX calcium-binding nonapeptide repeat (4 copies)